MVLHALDGNILSIFDALRLQDLREGPFSLLPDQPVFCERSGGTTFECGGCDALNNELGFRSYETHNPRVNAGLTQNRFLDSKLGRERTVHERVVTELKPVELLL